MLGMANIAENKIDGLDPKTDGVHLLTLDGQVVAISKCDVWRTHPARAT